MSISGKSRLLIPGRMPDSLEYTGREGIVFDVSSVLSRDAGKTVAYQYLPDEFQGDDGTPLQSDCGSIKVLSKKEKGSL